MPYTLYVLKCPNTNLVRYVGITSQQLQIRLYNHVIKKNDNKHKDSWIALLDRENKRPIIEGIYFNLSRTKACELEVATIKFYRKIIGKKLINILPGGNLPPNQSGKTRTFSELHKKRISDSCKGRVPYNKGKKMSNEQKEKISLAKKVYYSSVKWKTTGKTWSNAKMKARLVDPDGKLHDINNVYTFCINYGLDSSSIYRMIKGKKHSHKGWHLVGVKPKELISATVKNKDGITFKVTNIPKFCKAHNLGQSAFYKLVRGVKSIYKGWESV